MTTNILAATQSALITGYTLRGALLGSPFEWYKVSGPNNPLSPSNDMGTFNCYFDRDPTFPAQKAREYGKPEYYVAYDRGGPNVGDYLVSEDGTEVYFLIDQDALTPSKVVLTNAMVDFYRPGTPVPETAEDIANYVEASPNGDGILLASQWAISLLTGSRGEKSILGVPDGGREPWFNFLCPNIPGVRLKTDDKFVDQDNLRYQISAVELTFLGFRGTARLAEA